MTAIQAIALLLVAIAGPAVVLTRDPLRQVPVNGVFGLLLALLFFVFQAPDVALSEIVVGSIAVPAMVLLAIGRVRRRERSDSG